MATMFIKIPKQFKWISFKKTTLYSTINESVHKLIKFTFLIKSNHSLIMSYFPSKKREKKILMSCRRTTGQDKTDLCVLHHVLKCWAYKVKQNEAEWRREEILYNRINHRKCYYNCKDERTPGPTNNCIDWQYFI